MSSRSLKPTTKTHPGTKRTLHTYSIRFFQCFAVGWIIIIIQYLYIALKSCKGYRGAVTGRHLACKNVLYKSHRFAFGRHGLLSSCYWKGLVKQKPKVVVVILGGTNYLSVCIWLRLIVSAMCKIFVHLSRMEALGFIGMSRQGLLGHLWDFPSSWLHWYWKQVVANNNNYVVILSGDNDEK